MEYKIFKLSFQTAVHFGKGMLTDAEPVFLADTLFSALCQEAIYFPGGIENLYERCQRGALCFSDALPYIGNEFYIPKPFLTIETEENGDSRIKKAFKKLKYIPVSRINQYLCGEMDAIAEADQIARLGTFELRTNAAVFSERTEDLDHASGDSVPYHVGAYRYREGNGLYICVGFETEDDLIYFRELMEALSESGIGGRRSSGFGHFTATPLAKCPKELKERLTGKHYTKYISLSVSCPQESEMQEALSGSSYSLIKRSGFVASSEYADSHQKKRDFYVLAAGSCFSHLFQGGIYDMSYHGKHPVYRYARPMFIGVG